MGLGAVTGALGQQRGSAPPTGQAGVGRVWWFTPAVAFNGLRLGESRFMRQARPFQRSGPGHATTGAQNPRNPGGSGRPRSWRREGDSNSRCVLGTHALQACALNHSAISPTMLAPGQLIARLGVKGKPVRKEQARNVHCPTANPRAIPLENNRWFTCFLSAPDSAGATAPRTPRPSCHPGKSRR